MNTRYIKSIFSTILFSFFFIFSTEIVFADPVREDRRGGVYSAPRTDTNTTPQTPSTNTNGGTPASGAGGSRQDTPVDTATPWRISLSMTQGARGAQVKLLQAALMYEGYLKPSRVTTTFGKLTTAAVKKFQAGYDLDETGSIGEDERDTLNEVLDEMKTAGYVTAKGVVKFPPAGYTANSQNQTGQQTQTTTTNQSNPYCDAFGNCLR